MRLRLSTGASVWAAALLMWLPPANAAMRESQAPAAPPQEKGKPAIPEQARADEHKLPAERGDVVDRIVAIVNGDLVLESDVEEEERFTRLYPYRIASGNTLREQAINRLIDRALILQQEKGLVVPEATDAAVEKEERDLRTDLPECVRRDCKSDAGWKTFLTEQGFTEDELQSRLRQRSQVLTFIEQRFRSGIQITDTQIRDFYTGTMLPRYAKEHVPPPPLNVLSSRIEEVLLQQQVSRLLEEWLKTLRESGNVRVLKQGEDTP